MVLADSSGQVFNLCHDLACFEGTYQYNRQIDNILEAALGHAMPQKGEYFRRNLDRADDKGTRPWLEYFLREEVGRRFTAY